MSLLPSCSGDPYYRSPIKASSAFLVESKTNPKKEMTISNQPLCFRTDSTTSHHLLE